MAVANEAQIGSADRASRVSGRTVGDDMFVNGSHILSGVHDAQDDEEVAAAVSYVKKVAERENWSAEKLTDIRQALGWERYETSTFDPWADPTRTKVCNKCERELFVKEFQKNRKNKDMLHNSCRECLNAQKGRCRTKH